MIRRIQSVKTFGVFANFQWPQNLPEFKQFNLIYGWNYSGKTTLSRVFRCFEQKQPHIDFARAQVQLKDDNGTLYELSNPTSTHVFRVFNEDFVKENLSFESGSADPILILGAEDIAKQELLKAKRLEREALDASTNSMKRERTEIKTSIDSAFTKYARDFIKNPLSEVNYDKKRFEPIVKQCKDTSEQHLLDDAAIAKWMDIYRSSDKKDALRRKTASLSSLTALRHKTASLLAEVVAANNPISRLKDSPKVEKWVNDGRPLHKGKSVCQFCGQSLPPDLMTHLSEHFSVDYDNLMTELGELANEIGRARQQEISLDHKNDFYPELLERFTAAKNALDEGLKARHSALDSLKEAVAEKQTKAFTAMGCPPIEDTIDRITNAIEAINGIIDEHNSRTDEFDNKRKDAFAKLECHYAALFVRDERYNESLQKIADLDVTIKAQGDELFKLAGEVRALENAVSDVVKGAERINELLKAYFGRDDLRIEVSTENRFQIVRGDVLAKNLSEGEKTAIAFAYFITCAQDGRHPLDDTLIVVDDPISSLDANHIFNTYALIKTQLAACRQLFILTHNFEFYNLVREWMADDENKNKPQVEWTKWGVFLVRRDDGGQSVLEAIPKELLKFKSEYHYLFSILYHFNRNVAGDFDRLLSLPNVVRRFMEAFGGIMIPLSKGLKGKMDRIFTDEVVHERVWKFINHYSHNTTITRSLTIPDTSECAAVVQSCLDAVQNWSATYYDDLVQEVQ